MRLAVLVMSSKSRRSQQNRRSPLGVFPAEAGIQRVNPLAQAGDKVSAFIVDHLFGSEILKVIAVFAA
jgi:hypothetical protein